MFSFIFFERFFYAYKSAYPIFIQMQSRYMYSSTSCFSFFFFFIFIFSFWPCLMACGILVPRPGIEPGPLAVKVWSPNHWTTREFLQVAFHLITWLSFYIMLFVCPCLYILIFNGCDMTYIYDIYVIIITINIYII